MYLQKVSMTRYNQTSHQQYRMQKEKCNIVFIITIILILELHTLFSFLIFFYFYFFLYNTVLVLPYIDMNPPQVYMSSQPWTPLPPLSPYHLSGSSQCTSPKHPASCIEPRLAIHFLHDNIHVSMPFSQIISPSPSPSESKSLLYISVSFLLSCIQGHHCHLSKFHIYVLVYCIGVLKYIVSKFRLGWLLLISLTWRANHVHPIFIFLVFPLTK